MKANFDEVLSKVTEFLQRLYNNNEPGYFYLDCADTELPTDCVAFLNLSIAIKSTLHMDKCIAAKVLELTDTFQAKLGWLVGQQYSRVGTPDWPEEKIRDKIKRTLSEAAIWVEDSKIALLEEEMKNRSDDEYNRTVTSADIDAVMRRVPTKKQRVLDQAMQVLGTIVTDQKIRQLVRRELDNDASLAALLK